MTSDPINSFTGENAFLSNFFPHPITIADITYRTVEHAFQAAKTDNAEEKARIATAEYLRSAPLRALTLYQRRRPRNRLAPEASP